MNDEINAIERNNIWELFDPSKGGQPIDTNLVKNKLATKIARNMMNNKSVKGKNKLAKARNKSANKKLS